jgi:drug/metabolite transporter (DMT)-like permease
MRPTRLSTLIVVALGCALVMWLVLRAVYQSLPPLPWTGVPALLAMAAVEAGAGRDLRRRILGQRRAKPADPLLVSRMLVLAKASSLAAAVVAGLSLGFVGYLANMTSSPTPRHDIIIAGETCAAAIVLAAAALYLEYCCRVPTDTKPPTDVNVSADR